MSYRGKGGSGGDLSEGGTEGGRSEGHVESGRGCPGWVGTERNRGLTRVVSRGSMVVLVATGVSSGGS